MTDRAEQEGLARLDLARVVRLEADGRLTVHPDLRRVCSPLVVVLLHPVLTGLSVTIVSSLVIPLPRRTAGNVGPRVLILCSLATEPGRQLLIAAAKPIFGHADDDAVTDTVVQVRTGRGLASMTLTHNRGDVADINLAGRDLLCRIRRLRSNEASDKCATGGCCYSKGRHEARRYRPAFRCS